MNRSKSLILSEAAFFDVAASSLTDHEHTAPKRLEKKFSSFDLTEKSDDNDKIVEVAKSFLAKTCPNLLTVLASHPDKKSSRDRLVKIGRNANATLRYGEEVVARKKRGESALMGIWSADEEEELANETDRQMKTDDSLKHLVKECEDLAELLEGGKKVPTVRFGRTNLQMPIVTLGCMRFQQSWNRGGKPVVSADQLEKECQDNLVDIIRHAISCGVNHIETALGYGSSELQIGLALKQLLNEGFCKREDLIIQTKGFISSSMTKSDYKSQIIMQMEKLGVSYLDLFSVHGFNTDDHYDWVFNHGVKGNLIDAARELREEGKIRWIGFSTHGPSHVIKRAIESNSFDYVNLHYHFAGSYTASGDGDETFEGNLDNIRLAHKHDMGVFIISPYDKGGRVYAPSHLTRELTLPDLEPMEYASLWLWYHDKHLDANAPIHTIVCGAARPSDLDQPCLAALRSVTEEGKEDFDVVSRRIKARKESVLGKDWLKSWHVGLPNYSHSDRGSQIGNMVWLYNVIKVYGMLDFAKDRYNTLTGNAQRWDHNKSWKENVTSNPGFNWMPGCAYDPSFDYSSELKNVPEKNVQLVLKAMQFVHEWCAQDGSDVVMEAGADEKKECDAKIIPLEWQCAYDMRPWTAFPER
mmetsp:Transcript_18676/g.37087  ORF Transcript_18676/g.37087 Transcript_18676/m.37087 type:complete len:640 (-) Transcript_18676:54-1973(-)|eukprot:CAMPEP_0171358998 /NCGR_PEP_ID=MMETSP0879-20121228/344_1 /TAXON_ID=67004 /ORGANISM="Thalassiosira weissflogii, Strain CCMP1336" /LENGTH=639 /DNA_ID=CAMNT_0011865125 /DNA_START=44 /DNA_END=1963 /DNA_ORIENTATION=+